MSNRALSTLRRCSPLPTPGSAHKKLQMAYRSDRDDGGLYRVGGTVGVKGAPDVLGRYRVRLFCEISGRLVRECWSSNQGVYDFRYVRRGPWMVIATDHTGNYNAVPADRAVGEKI